MNTYRLAVLSVLTVCGSLAPLASAQSASPSEGRQVRRDGVVDKKKRDAKQDARRAVAKDAADTNNDGKLSPEEMKVVAEKAQARRERIKAKLDTDGDGKISASEWRAVSDEWNDFDADFDKTLKSLDGQARQAMIKSLDTNGDGKLDESERAALREKVMQARFEMLMRFDADGDGKLSGEERRALGEALRAAKTTKPVKPGEGQSSENKGKGSAKKSGDSKPEGDSGK